jgi:hypothetical protein
LFALHIHENSLVVFLIPCRGILKNTRKNSD